MSTYRDFLATKALAAAPHGIDGVSASDLPDCMFPHQRDVTAFALRTGSSALFLDTGLGKTLCELVWADRVVSHTGRPVLILAPLAVAWQIARESERFGISAHVARDQSEVGSGIAIANYDRLHLFDPSVFGGIVLDESSILKGFNGKTTKALIDGFSRSPFRLAATATPAPNDHTEIGTHAEFLGWMPRDDMLSRWFAHDSGNTAIWRIKGHAVKPFWSWVASWARCVSKPSDLGYDDAGYDLPQLHLIKHEVAADRAVDTDGLLFRCPDMSATSLHKEKRLTLKGRVRAIAEAVTAEPSEPWIVWCDTDYEADALANSLPDAVEVRGSHKAETKEDRLLAFTRGDIRVIITKPSIAGFGLNWQHCARQAFVGLSFSYEAFYQAIRRSWRFGQTRPVHAHVALADTERAIWDAIVRKRDDHDTLKREMTEAMKRAAKASRVRAPYEPAKAMRLPSWMEAS